LRSILAGAVLVLLALVGWESLYYGPYQSKDLRYQCWKLGLYSLKIKDALETMVVDPRRDTLVLGRTQEQLVSKFGYVSSIEEADNYVKYCYDNSQYRGTEVLFLRKSHWMVAMTNGRASGLLFVKGC
jgi:hypothetical protein